MKGEVIKPNTGAFLFSGKGSCCQLVWITAVSRARVPARALTLSDSKFAGWFGAGRRAAQVCKSSTSALLAGRSLVAAGALSSSVRSASKKRV